MAKASPAIAAFNAGEWSPQMEGRTDVEKYPIASHIGQNFISLKQGPATYRPGTVFVQPVKNSSTRTWLVRFEFSQTQAYQLEFGDRYVRFYTNHGPLLNGSVIYEIVSPYAGADLTDALGLFTLQVIQSGDVLYIAGGNAGSGYPPYTLTRFANNPPDWRFALYAPTDGPYADPPPLVPGSEIAMTVSAVQGLGITINAYGVTPFAATPFAATDVGRLVRIGSQYFNVEPWTTQVGFAGGDACSNNGNNYVCIVGGTTGGSPPVHTSGSAVDGQGTSGVRWLYTDSGYGVAKITAFISSTQVTADVLTRFPANVVGSTSSITAISNASPCVVTAAQTTPVGQALFITGVLGMTQVNQIPYSNQVQNSSTVTLAGIDSSTYGAYLSGGTLIINATTEWKLGAWSNTTEWPRCAAFFKDRLFWATKLNLYGSVPGLYTSHAPDFFGVQTTDAAINVLVTGTDSSTICWLNGAIILLIGTEGGEYGLDAANYSASPLGPANIEILRQSNWRCSHVPAQLVGTSVLYMQRASRKLFAMDYNFYLNRYDSTDQSKFAYHITIGGVTQLAYQQEPWSVLWGIRTDGTLLSYTYNREDNVTAWNRHNLGGNGIVESISVTPAPDGLRDELWMIVNRTVNGQVIRTVEYMAKHFEGPQGGYIGDAQSSAWYVDCGVQAILPATFAITGVSSAGNIHGGNTTYQCVNNFIVGQSVFVSGVLYTGTFNPNVQGALITQATGTSFTIAPFAFGGMFSYLGGGSASVGSSASQTISGLPPVLWNQTVAILADGAAQPQAVVSSTGTLSLPTTFNVVTIGFPYQGNLVPMRPEGGADTGTAQGKKKQGATLVLRLVDSAGGTVGRLSNQNYLTQAYQDPLGLITQSIQLQEAIVYNYTNTPLDSPPPVQSGDFPISFPDNAASDQDQSDFYILVQQVGPLPMTVVGIYPNYKVEEWQ